MIIHLNSVESIFILFLNLSFILFWSIAGRRGIVNYNDVSVSGV